MSGYSEVSLVMAIAGACIQSPRLGFAHRVRGRRAKSENTQGRIQAAALTSMGSTACLSASKHFGSFAVFAISSMIESAFDTDIAARQGRSAMSASNMSAVVRIRVSKTISSSLRPRGQLLPSRPSSVLPSFSVWTDALRGTLGLARKCWLDSRTEDRIPTIAFFNHVYVDSGTARVAATAVSQSSCRVLPR